MRFYPTEVNMDLPGKPNSMGVNIQHPRVPTPVNKSTVFGPSHKEANTCQRSKTTRNERRYPRFTNGLCTFQLASINFVLFGLLTPFCHLSPLTPDITKYDRYG